MNSHDVIQCVLDAAQHRDCGEDVEDAVRKAERPAARVLNKMIDGARDFFSRLQDPLVLSEGGDGCAVCSGRCAVCRSGDGVGVQVYRSGHVVGIYLEIRCLRRIGSRFRRHICRAKGTGWNDAGDEFNDEIIDALLSFFLQDTAGDAHDYCQHGDQGQQAGISQRRSPGRAAITGETLPYQHPEMRKLLELRERGLGGDVRLIPEGNGIVPKLFPSRELVCHSFKR